MPLSTFPFQIYGGITDFLAEGGSSLSSIQQCALVCRDFLLLARNHLFDDIVLNCYELNNDAKTSNNAQVFTELISSSPEIALYVRTSNTVLPEDFAIGGLVEALKSLTTLDQVSILQSRRSPLEPYASASERRSRSHLPSAYTQQSDT